MVFVNRSPTTTGKSRFGVCTALQMMMDCLLKQRLSLPVVRYFPRCFSSKRKNGKCKKSSSLRKQWQKRQERDIFVKEAAAGGFRSRASFKLQGINDKFRIIKPGNRVIDLGAAPGSWSQVAAQLVFGKHGGTEGCVIAVDLELMELLPQVSFIRGDFTDERTKQMIYGLTKDEKFDVVLSDMAPKFSGSPSLDRDRQAFLVEDAYEFAGESVFCLQHLIPLKVMFICHTS